MSKTKKFTDVFNKLKFNTNVCKNFNESSILEIKINETQKHMEITIVTNNLLSASHTDELKMQLHDHFPMIKTINIKIIDEEKNQKADVNDNSAPENDPYLFDYSNDAIENKMSEQNPNRSSAGMVHKLKIQKYFKNIDNIRPLADDFNADEEVCVNGVIFSLDKREIKQNRILLVFDISDETSAMTVKCFTTPEQYKNECANFFQKGAAVVIKGFVQHDSYAGEKIILAYAAAPGKIPEIRTDDAPVKRVELHLHSQMSATDGVTPISEFIKRASYWGHTAIAITDHGAAQAYPEAMEAAKKTDLKILYGTEAYLIHGPENKQRNYHAVIFAKNQKGLRNLYELISISHTNYFYKRPRVPKEEFIRLREGLVIGSACESGELFCALREGKSVDAIENIASFYDYLEIQPLANNFFMLRSGAVASEDVLIDYNKQIVSLGEKLGIPVAATCDAHFLDPANEVYRRIIMYGDGYEDADNQAPLFYRTTNEMLSEFKYLGEEKAYEVVVANTNLIAGWFEKIKPIPDGTFPPKIPGADEELKNLVYSKATSIYGNPLPDPVKQRLEYEMNSIIKNGFAVMYVAAQKLVSQSEADGYLVGSRGSVGSSLAATMSGVTEVNPLPAHYVCPSCKYSDFDSPAVLSYAESSGCDMPYADCPKCGAALHRDGHNIPFETFLGFDFDKEPDIDLNFSGEYQAKAHAHAEKLFGEEYVFKAGTIATIAEKTAYGYVKKYFEAKHKTMRKSEINKLVLGCTGIKRTTGQHPGGLIIVPKGHSIYDFCPIQFPGGLGDSNAKVVTTHFDYHSMEGRLFKLDILGHDVPTIIRMLHDFTGIDPRSVPLSEKEVLSLFTSSNAMFAKSQPLFNYVPCSTGTLGLPEFGTGFVRQMLVETQPRTFTDLLRISGLSHGTNVWTNNAQELIKNEIATLKEVITIRDDIMLYLIRAGIDKKTAFKITELVRKKNTTIGETEERIMDQAGVPDWYIDSCKKIEYMFPKGHATAYVIMTVRIGYFKLYKPSAFYAAVFSVKTEDFDYTTMCTGYLNAKKACVPHDENLSATEKSRMSLLEIVMEMYARGIDFAPLDLYKSDAYRFLPVEGSERLILPPLSAVPGLGLSAAKKIVDERAIQPFFTIEQFKDRTKVNKTVLALLRSHNMLDGLPEDDQITLL